MALISHRPLISFPSLHRPRTNPSRRISCLSSRSNPIELKPPNKEYSPGPIDDIFLNVFRSKLALESGWDSEKPGYDGLIEGAHRLMVGRSNSAATETAVRILLALFPPWLLKLYKKLVSPIAGGKVASEMVGVTAISCQWLMGTCTVNTVDVPNGSSWSSGVFVEKCKYLEESDCVGVCINTCKLPTQVGNFLLLLLHKKTVYIFHDNASSNLGYSLHRLKRTVPSRSRAFRYARLPIDKDKFKVPQMYQNVQRLNTN